MSCGRAASVTTSGRCSWLRSTSCSRMPQLVVSTSTLPYTKGVVCKAQSAHDVLEARLDLTVTLDGEQRHLRLYFSEPDDEDHLLLSLSFRHKRGGGIGLEEQDQHIAEAQKRFDSWSQTRRMR